MVTKPVKRAWGRDFIYDRRDKKHMVPNIGPTRRNDRYWSDLKYFGDQGSTPQCVGYAWMHWLVNYPINQFVNPTGIYTHSQHVDEWEGNNYDGTSVRGGAKVLHNLGFIDEYQWITDIDNLVNVVLNVGPVVVGTTWYSGMSWPDHRGHIKTEGAPLGGHAYLINGANHHHFRIKNSWGRDWGRDGRAYISISDFAALLNNQGEACLAIEAKPTP